MAETWWCANCHLWAAWGHACTLPTLPDEWGALRQLVRSACEVSGEIGTPSDASERLREALILIGAWAH